MKRFLIITSICLTAAVAQAQDYFKEYGNAPIRVINKTQDPASTQELTLVNLDRNELILRFPNRQGEVGLPIDTENLKLEIIFPDSVNKAYKQIDNAEYEEAITTLRPMVYPLMKYFDIPPENMNLHEIVERYTFALVSANGHEEEVETLFKRIPLEKAPPVFSLHALRFVTKLVEQEKKQEALRLLNRIPMDKDSTPMLKLVLKFADELREGGNLNEALFLYDRLQQAKGTPQAEIAQMWSAYCNVSLDRSQLALILLERVGKLKPEDDAYSLGQLVLGKIELQDLDYMNAMEEIAKGVVAADVSFNWTPELSYNAGYCYEKLDAPDTAREIYNEIMLFYPESKWAREAETGLTRLPPPAPKEVEDPGA